MNPENGHDVSRTWVLTTTGRKGWERDAIAEAERLAPSWGR